MNKSTLGVEDIKNLELLARLHVSEGSRYSLVDEVSSIVQYIGQIDDLDLGIIDNSTMMHSHKNVTRSDEVNPTTTEGRQIILDDAPNKDADFIKVTQVIKK